MSRRSAYGANLHGIGRPGNPSRDDEPPRLRHYPGKMAVRGGEKAETITGPRAVLGSQRVRLDGRPELLQCLLACTWPLRAEDGSRSVPGDCESI